MRKIVLKDHFVKLPEALQKQVLLRFGACLISLLLFFILLIIYTDIYLCISFGLFAIVFGIAGTILFVRVSEGKYVTVSGCCQEVERTTLRRKAKSVLITMEPHIVRIQLHHTLKNIAEGDYVTVYVAENMPVYQKEGCEVLNGYLAIETKKGSRTHDGN